MYADDVLLFLADLVICLPNLVSTLRVFQVVSGLGLNLSKCSALPINFLTTSISSIQSKFGFTLNGETLPYLGIKLAPSLHKMLHINYPQAFSHIRQLLGTWAPYHISFLGRVQAVKMSILPKLLYYFRALPIYVSRQTLELIQGDINKCIFSKRKDIYLYFDRHIYF